MVIKDKHVREACLRLLAATEENAVDALVDGVLERTGGVNFATKISNLLGRVKTSRYKTEIGIEVVAAIRAIYAILGPIQAALQEKGVDLPEVTLHDFEGTNDFRSGEWDRYFHRFSNFNYGWHVLISGHLDTLKSNTSKIIIYRLTRVYIEALPIALKPEVAPHSSLASAA